MGVFDDKKFDDLDWISQAVEPIDSNLNKLLAIIPDETVINFDFFYSIVYGNATYALQINDVIEHMYGTKHELALNGWAERSALNDCFTFYLEPGTIIDFEKGEIIGLIKLIKNKSTMDEKTLSTILGNDGASKISLIYLPKDGGSTRANEVMEVLGQCEVGIRSRSDSSKRNILYKRVLKLFKENEWNIRDTELANKVGYWIKAYIEDGNLAAFSNLCRLKVMTHKGQPIYSMEEIV